VRYTVLVRKIRDAATGQGVDFEMKRQRGSHQMWTCGHTAVVIPKHTEVNELTARSIFKTLEAELGKEWWK
jgi:predicted RNA binding protein YcfA (HicA-like mRNA interferase family)